jgi:hypothetical protein
MNGTGSVVSCWDGKLFGATKYRRCCINSTGRSSGRCSVFHQAATVKMRCRIVCLQNGSRSGKADYFFAGASKKGSMEGVNYVGDTLLFAGAALLAGFGAD